MAKFLNSSVLDGGLTKIQQLIDNDGHTLAVWVIKAYTFGDSYATALTNRVATGSLTSGELSYSTVSNNRVLTIASRVLTASVASGATPDLHVAVVDATASQVLLVTDETSNQVIANGQAIAVPSFTWTSNQPT